MSAPVVLDAVRKAALLASAREAARHAFAPYSHFHVGAAVLIADGSVVTGANVENASYGLSLCAETVAIAKVLGAPWQGPVLALAVTGGPEGAAGQGARVTPCGRCRQVLLEAAMRGGSDPLVLCDGRDGVLELPLSQLLPHAFDSSGLTSSA